MAEFEVIRGAENEIEFQGFRGIYVWYLLGGLTGSIFLGLVLFVVLPSPTMAGIITLVAAGLVVYFCFTFNKKYGKWGLAKAMIQKKLPSYVIMTRPRSLRRKANATAQR